MTGAGTYGGGASCGAAEAPFLHSLRAHATPTSANSATLARLEVARQRREARAEASAKEQARVQLASLRRERRAADTRAAAFDQKRHVLFERNQIDQERAQRVFVRRVEVADQAQAAKWQ